MPLVNPNYLNDEEDVDTLVQALAKLDKMADTKAFKKYQMEPVVDTFNCGKVKYGTKEYRECVVR